MTIFYVLISNKWLKGNIDHPMKSGLGFVLASLYVFHSGDQVLVYVFCTENVVKIMAMKIDITLQ